jgi:DNA-directed RNA polymerase beta' subunit
MSAKRNLYESEIDDIVSSTLGQYNTLKNLPENMRLKFEDEFRKQIENELKKIQIYPEGIPKLKKKVIEKFRLVPAAKSVGIICGQSIGEMQTQTTLNTFHSAGIANRTVVQGVPRFLEIIDTNRSETQGTPTATIFFKHPIPKTIVEARKRVKNSLICFTFNQLFERHWIALPDQAIENWYDMHPEHSTLVDTHSRICYAINLDILYRYEITLEQIYEVLKTSIPDIKFFYSPLFEGRIDAWTTEEDKMEEILHPKILQTKICGIDRVENVFFMKQNGEWYIETDGSNLEEIMNLDYIDSFRTFSNDIWEIYNLFGIEAIRTYIVEELTNLMPTIHSSHIHLLTDRMTVTGRLKSISRYTRKHENSSVLSKATFEETLSGFLRSALTTEKDTINGSSASIICGKVPRVGTGMNDLLFSGYQ